MLTLLQGAEGLWAVIFFPVAAFWAVIFCPPRCSELHSVQWGHLFSGVCGIRCRQCSPLFWRLQNSVPERASYGTEYACRAQKGFLRYATRFLKPSVLKTGFWGTEGIFGTGNALLRYATHLQRRRTASCRTECTFGYPAVLKPFHNSIQKWQSLIRKPEGYYFTKKVLTNECSCLSVKLSMPTLSINAYSAFLFVITNLRSFPSTSHKR